jgi:ABC-2 type transport system permease protein
VLVLVGLQLLFVIGVALALSVLNVWFRDIQHLATIGFQIWFYLTPVVYSPELVSGQGATIYAWYRVNPMFHFVQAYRDLLYNGRLPTLATWGACVLSAAVSLVAGWLVFRRFQGDLAEEL